jgi:Ser/Thr protein kinase RdoA (MazF antagonist)
MVALARFHRAAQGFRVPGGKAGPSPGIGHRLKQARQWLAGGLDELSALLGPAVCPGLFDRARRVLALAGTTGPALVPRLEAAAGEQVPLQPCIRDVWRNHVLFEADRVSGLIDFGSLAVDNVAADVARLLGSLAGDDPALREVGLSAYASVRPLGDVEALLLEAFDQSTVVMSGLNWCDWIYRQHRTFADWRAVGARLDEILGRLEHLARGAVPTDTGFATGYNRPPGFDRQAVP